MYCEADASMILTRESGWKEVKLGRIYIPEITYDPNGNILHQEITELANTDDLGYHYSEAFPNRLLYVTGGDAVTGLIPQADSNYTYDAIGNLIEDIEEGTELTWDVFGKLRTVNGGTHGLVEYTYDVQGNRLSKHAGETEHVYVRDATGNIIVIYHLRYFRST